MPQDTEEQSMINELGEVRTCGCGGVNLYVGAVTIHFEAEEIDDLHELSGAALEMIGGTLPGSGKRKPAGASKPERSFH